MMSVTPHDAASNFSQWLTWIGLSDLPAWLTAKSADNQIALWVTVWAITYVALVWGVPLLFRWIKNRSEHKAPMSIVCDFVPIIGLYDNVQNYILRFGVRNNSDRTIISVRLILHESWFSRAFFSKGGRDIRSETVVLTFDRIDPKTTEIMDVMSIDPVIPDGPNILSGVLQFTLEARAIDTFPAKATIEYDPTLEKRFRIYRPASRWSIWHPIAVRH
jgi:hypothetical protein